MAAVRRLHVRAVVLAPAAQVSTRELHTDRYETCANQGRDRAPMVSAMASYEDARRWSPCLPLPFAQRIAHTRHHAHARSTKTRSLTFLPLWTSLTAA